MKYNTNHTSAFDRTVKSLCRQIDELTEEVEFWKAKYEQERREYMEHINHSLEQSKQGVANALMFALSVQEGENGELVIPAENRKMIAEQIKSRDNEPNQD